MRNVFRLKEETPKQYRIKRFVYQLVRQKPVLVEGTFYLSDALRYVWHNSVPGEGIAVVRLECPVIWVELDLSSVGEVGAHVSENGGGHDVFVEPSPYGLGHIVSLIYWMSATTAEKLARWKDLAQS